MDDGRLTDSQGFTVDFKNVVVIMTSNVGSRYLQDNLVGDENLNRLGNQLWLNCVIISGCEFLNRIDDVVLFCRYYRWRKLSRLLISYSEV